MLLISLTGGIGTGKSTAANLLRQRGAHVLVLDDVARTVLDPGTPATWEVGQLWPTVVRDGIVDRAGLAQIVFNDPEALAQLNAITHPRTWQAAERILERWNAEDSHGVAIIEIAILAGSVRRFASHLNVVVGADTDVRMERLAGRGLAPEDARARMNNQHPQAELAGLADVWLDNSGSPSELASQICELWENRLVPYAQNLAAGERRFGTAREPAPADVQRCLERLAYHGISAERSERAGELAVLWPDSGGLAPSYTAALAAAGFVPGEGCYEVADPEYYLSLQ